MVGGIPHWDTLQLLGIMPQWLGRVKTEGLDDDHRPIHVERGVHAWSAHTKIQRLSRKGLGGTGESLCVIRRGTQELSRLSLPSLMIALRVQRRCA